MDPFSDVPLSPLQTRKLRARGAPRVQSKRRGHPEDNLHASIWKQLQVLLSPCVVAWSVENRNLGMFEGQRRKKRGVIAGVPDMVFHWSGRTAYVELKAGKNNTSDAQDRLHARLRMAAIPVGVCWSLDEVLSFLTDCGCPMRGRVGA